jgi:hypothetical protein
MFILSCTVFPSNQAQINKTNFPTNKPALYAITLLDTIYVTNELSLPYNINLTTYVPITTISTTLFLAVSSQEK